MRNALVWKRISCRDECQGIALSGETETNEATVLTVSLPSVRSHLSITVSVGLPALQGKTGPVPGALTLVVIIGNIKSVVSNILVLFTGVAADRSVYFEAFVATVREAR